MNLAIEINAPPVADRGAGVAPGRWRRCAAGSERYGPTVEEDTVLCPRVGPAWTKTASKWLPATPSAS